MQIDASKTALLIMPILFSGGGEKQYRYIIENLSTEKYRIIVLLLHKPLPEFEKITNEYINNHKEIEFIQLQSKGLQKNGNNIVRAKMHKIIAFIIQFRWLYRFLKKTHIDLAMYSYISQLVLTPLFKKYNVKTIFNERNTGRQICDKDYKVKLLKKCDIVIANSKYAATYISNRIGIPVNVINNGIEIDAIKHRKHRKFIILVPARLTPVKNQMIVVKAINNIINETKQLKSDEVEVFFAGNIEDRKYYNLIKEEIHMNNLPIKILGQIKNIKEYYEISDVLILPSTEEGTPNVLLEAYMYNVFPIISNIPMNVDCCIDDRILFDYNNYKELSELIMSVRYNNLLYVDDFNKKAHQFLAENYDMKLMSKKYDQLFSSI